MAGYADYDFYMDTYLGNAISEANFPRLITRASEMIDQLTYGRAEAMVEAALEVDQILDIGLATCSIAEEYQRVEQQTASGGLIASEKEGQYAVSYVETPEVVLPAMARYQKAARVYLGLTGLMYPGLDEDER